MRCRVCHHTQDNQLYYVREMMHGTKERFAYFQCFQCRCLQIAEFPGDMTLYYPPDYIGFNAHNPQYTARFGIPLWANTMDFDLIEDVLHAPPGTFGGRRQLAKLLMERAVEHYLPQIKGNGQVRILDVGCGSGELLFDLYEIGFQHTLGIDLFIEQPIVYSNGVRVIKGTIEEVEPAWDVIMFHHAFEHIPDPLRTLQAIAKLLSSLGVCLIRIPIVPSYVWKTYGPDWVQLDAPRHFFLHSVQSMTILAERAGLRLEKVLYDSNLTQFCGTLQYRQDIPLFCERSYLVDPQNSIFTEAEVVIFWEEARLLNKMGQGDQAAFYLRK